MKLIATFRITLLAVATAVLALSAGAVFAHEQREGEVEWVVGFLHEPAYEGQINGAYLKLTKQESGEQEDGHSHPEAVPVEGVHQTLQVEVTHIPTGASIVLNLRPVFDTPGEYVADLVPTAPGGYQFRFFGTIEGEQVDEPFVSEGFGGGFDDVRSSVDLQFPVKLPEVREIEGAVRGAQTAAAQAQDAATSADDNASSAGMLAIVGIVLAAVGITVGVGGVALALRRR